MRRTAISVLVIVCCGQLLASSAPARLQQRQDPRPNILFFFADDWGRYASIYAALERQPSLNQVVKTPNIDRVAREGVLFRNAFVNAPSCTPCRSSLLSGRYFFNTGRGAILQTAQWDGAIPSFPLCFATPAITSARATRSGAPARPPMRRSAGKHAYEKAGKLPNNFSENVTTMMGEGQTLDAAREKLFGQVRANFDAFLADRKPGQPWLYWFGPTTTHRRWIKGSGKKLWGIEPDALKGKMPPFLPDVPEVREDVADYLGEVQAFDAYVGVLLKRLEETGELDEHADRRQRRPRHARRPGRQVQPLRLRHRRDAGRALAPGAKAGRVVDDFVSLPDLAPTFLEAAGVGRPGGHERAQPAERAASDAAGRWTRAARGSSPGANGTSPSPTATTCPTRSAPCGRTTILYIRNFAPDRWPMGVPVAVTEASAPPQDELESDTYAAFADMDASPTKAWLVAHRNDAEWKRLYDVAFAQRPAEELYDLRNDPHQVKNVAADAKYAATKAG